MKKNKEARTGVSNGYAAPQIEVYVQASYNQLLQSGSNFGGGAGDGDLDDVGGAKAMDLGVEFKFKDLWEDENLKD